MTSTDCDKHLPIRHFDPRRTFQKQILGWKGDES